MNIREITLLLTEKCNFNCSYCYQWNASGKDIDPLIAKKGIQYAIDNSADELTITFSGGEPLLQYSLIEKCIYFLKKKAVQLNKKISFAIITNGSLISDPVLAFLNDNNFDLHYSFNDFLKDGPAESDILAEGKAILKKLLKAENIILSTNTVFTPKNVNAIFDSVHFLYDEGVEQIGISLDQTSFWDNKTLQIFRQELEKTEELVISEYNKSGKIIVDYFSLNEPIGINTCGAAGDRLTIMPDGSIWGCAALYFLDWENIKEPKDQYNYGHINDRKSEKFEQWTEVVRKNYSELRTDNFKTEKTKCFLCDYLQECRICPAQKYSFIKGKRSMFDVPDQICRMNKIIFDSNREFKEEISRLTNN